MPYGCPGVGGYSGGCNNGGFLNPYTLIILILIVLQWFRVGCYPVNGGVGGAGIGPEPGLLNNGGLFIIAIFLLIYCSCNRPQMPLVQPTRYICY